MSAKSTLNRILLIILLAANVPALAQVTVAETFDFQVATTVYPNTDLPFGWRTFPSQHSQGQAF